MSHTPPQTFQSLANEYRDLVNNAREQHGEELQKTITRLNEIEIQLHKAAAAIPRYTGDSTNYRNELCNTIVWISAATNPTQWANQTSWVPRLRSGCDLEGRFKVKLEDGREIFTWWKDGQWSVERLKPNLKVAFWEQPVWIA